MTEIEQRAEEMLRLMKKCPANGVTERDVAVAFLARERSAGKVEATQEVGKRLFSRASAHTGV